MPNKTPALISSVSTILILVLFAIFSVFVQMLALNGVSESQGVTAMGISLLCQAIIAMLAGIFTGWLTNFTIRKFNWNKVLAVILSVIAGTLSGAMISFLALIISLPLAGIR
jgi:hypothetical protein